MFVVIRRVVVAMVREAGEQVVTTTVLEYKYQVWNKNSIPLVDYLIAFDAKWHFGIDYLVFKNQCLKFFSSLGLPSEIEEYLVVNLIVISTSI